MKKYKIKAGDTLSKISKRTGLAIGDLAKNNNIKDINKIFVGQELNLDFASTPKKKATKNKTFKATPTQPKPTVAAYDLRYDEFLGHFKQTDSRASDMAYQIYKLNPSKFTDGSLARYNNDKGTYRFNNKEIKSLYNQYATGGTLTNYVENPAVELAQNDQAIATSLYAGASNPFGLGLEALGGMFSSGQMNQFFATGGTAKKYANGGTAPNPELQAWWDGLSSEQKQQVFFDPKYAQHIESLGELANLNQSPEIVLETSKKRNPKVTPKEKPSKKDPDSLLEDIFEVVDPTGISSWDDVGRAWSDGKLDANDVIEPIGALPFLGKASKAFKYGSKALDAMSGGLAKAGKVSKVVGTGDDAYDLSNREEYATGGTTGVKANVEGEEVIETPDGKLAEMKGPSHENGGIDVALPEGTDIYSKRVKIGGKTMAERKKAREKRITFLEDLYKNDASPMVANTYKREMATLEAEDAHDMEIQNQLHQEQQQFATGGTFTGPLNKSWYETGLEPSPFWMQNTFTDSQTPVNLPQQKLETTVPFLTQKDADAVSKIPKTYPTKTTVPQVPNAPSTGVTNPKSSLGFGDILNMGGNAIGAIAPYLVNEQQRANTDPNQNFYKGYGEDALAKMDQMKKYVGSVEDNQRQDLELSRNNQIARNRAGARSVNTMRALDSATDAGIDAQGRQISNSAAAQMMNILGQEANLHNNIDQVVMIGEKEADIANRMDADNYYSNKAAALTNMGEGISAIGGNLNQNKLNNTNLNLLNSSSKYGTKMNADGTFVNNVPEGAMPTVSDNMIPDSSVLLDNPPQKDYVGGDLPAGNSLQGLKDELADVESRGSGGYSAVNADTGAMGKYQFVPRWHMSKIKDVTGVKNQQEFIDSPEAQEKYMDHVLAGYQKRVGKYRDDILTRFPNLNQNDLIKLNHYQPGLLNKLAKGTIDLSHKPGKGINKTLAQYLGKE